MVDKADPVTYKEYGIILGVSTRTALRYGKPALRNMIAERALEIKKRAIEIEKGNIKEEKEKKEKDIEKKRELNERVRPSDYFSDYTVVGREETELLKVVDTLKVIDENTKIDAHIVQSNAMKILRHYTELLVLGNKNDPTQQISVFVAKNVIDIVKMLAGRES